MKNLNEEELFPGRGKAARNSKQSILHSAGRDVIGITMGCGCL